MLRFVILTVGYLVFSICQTATVYAGEDNNAVPSMTSLPDYREGKLPKGIYFVIGTFKNISNARKFNRRYKKFDAFVYALESKGEKIFRIVIGPVKKANQSIVHSFLQKSNVEGAWEMHVNPEKIADTKRKVKKDTPLTRPEILNKSGSYFVIGVFRSLSNAQRFKLRFNDLSPKVVTSKTKYRKLFRVVVGPIKKNNKNEVLKLIRAAGVEKPWEMKVLPTNTRDEPSDIGLAHLNLKLKPSIKPSPRKAPKPSKKPQLLANTTSTQAPDDQTRLEKLPSPSTLVGKTVSSQAEEKKTSSPPASVEKASSPLTLAEKPSSPPSLPDKPSLAPVTVEKLALPLTLEEKPSSPLASLEKPVSPPVSPEKPASPLTLAEKPSPPSASLEKPSSPPAPPLPMKRQSYPLPNKSKYKTGDIFDDCDPCPEMIVIPAGKFTMGAGDGGMTGDAPATPVTLPKPIAMGRFEVTFTEWDACVSDGGCSSYTPDDEGWGRENRPVINVNWNDTKAYVKWLSAKTKKLYRLPSEAEWEYAARGGSSTNFWWGDQVGINQAVCQDCGSIHDNKKSAPVGKFSPNGFGLYDTAGNLWEWTQDCYSMKSYRKHPNYPESVSGPEGCSRVLRGGGWDIISMGLRSSFRFTSGSSNRTNIFGFRVVRELQ